MKNKVKRIKSNWIWMFIAIVICVIITEMALADWASSVKILASDGAPSDRFGNQVALDGNYAIVGAHGDDGYTGAAYIYHFNDLSWTEQIKLVAADGASGDAFGLDVDIHQDYAIVGAPSDDDNGENSGSAYVFYRHPVDGWIQQDKLLPSDGAPGDQFGNVAIHNDWAVVGATAQQNTNSGAAYIFHFDGSHWIETRKLSVTSSDPDLRFGSGVSIFNSWVLVGASQDDELGANAGAAYVYNIADPTWSQKLTASDGAAGERFGILSCVDGDTAIVGAYHASAAYVFKFNGSNWIEQTKLVFPDGVGPGHELSGLSIHDEYIVMGKEGNDEMGTNAGAAYVFRNNGLEWKYIKKLFASDPAANDRFGISVDISDDHTIVGADLKNGWTGAAYVYEMSPPSEFFDDFEDGSIDTNLWVVGGNKRGNVHIGEGAWQVEIVEENGYLMMRVWGPPSGITNGAEAWARSVYNFNDDQSHIINFTWAAEIIESHYNTYFIQITDGYIPYDGSVHWPHSTPYPGEEPIPGTVNFLWRDTNGIPGIGWFRTQNMDPNSMSLVINSNCNAQLYSEPDGGGELMQETILDANKPWYFRCMVIDATSSGFGAGECNMKLNDFSAYNIPRVFTPHGGEKLIVGNYYPIKWEVTESINNVMLELSPDNGNTWIIINPATENDGLFNWKVQHIISTGCLVRVSDADDINVSDTSDESFEIFECYEFPIGDFNYDCHVNLFDFAISTRYWMLDGNNANLEALWHFDEGSGINVDDSVNGHDGTAYGDPNWIDGIKGKAMYFDGLDDYIDVPYTSDINLSPAFTLSAWVKFENYNDDSVIVGKHFSGQLSGYFLGVRMNRFCFYVDGEAVNNSDRIISSEQYHDNQWHHVVGVYDGTKQYLYVDGNLEATQERIYDSFNQVNIRLGGLFQGQNNGAFNGYIDEVRLYNEVLDDHRIKNLYRLRS